MIVFIFFILLICNSFLLNNNTLNARTVEPEVKSLNLNWDIYWKNDTGFGGEARLIKKIQQYPNLETLSLVGQNRGIDLMQAIHDHLPHLKKLTLTGVVLQDCDNDEMAYCTCPYTAIRPFKISTDMLQALIGNESFIEILDLSMTAMNDDTLINLVNARELKELYLRGNPSVTYEGVLALVNNLPNLRLLDLSAIELYRYQRDNTFKVGPEVAFTLIQQMEAAGFYLESNDGLEKKFKKHSTIILN